MDHSRVRLRTHAPRLEWITELPNREVCKKHINEGKIDIDIEDKKYRSDMEFLRQSGHLKEIGEVHEYQKRYWKVWKIEKRAYDIIEEALDADETLPCGHRFHILNKSDGGYGCKYCDEDRNWTAEEIKEAKDG